MCQKVPGKFKSWGINTRRRDGTALEFMAMISRSGQYVIRTLLFLYLYRSGDMHHILFIDFFIPLLFLFKLIILIINGRGNDNLCLFYWKLFKFFVTGHSVLATIKSGVNVVHL